jgi:hypothetical protein
VSLAKDFALALPHRLNLASVALLNLIAKGNMSAQGQPPAQPFTQSMAVEKAATTLMDRANEVNMRADNRTSLPAMAEDAPMQHLFLLDMKKGR